MKRVKIKRMKNNKNKNKRKGAKTENIEVEVREVRRPCKDCRCPRTCKCRKRARRNSSVGWGVAGLALAGTAGAFLAGPTLYDKYKRSKPPKTKQRRRR